MRRSLTTCLKMLQTREVMLLKHSTPSFLWLCSPKETQLHRATVVSHQAAAEALFGILHGSITLLTRAWCSCLSMDLALVAASPITTGRKSICALIAIVTLLKLWQHLSSDSLWPSQSLLFFCFLSAERAGRMKDSWEGRESWMWTKSCQRNMRREFCPISFNKVVG